MVTDGDDNEFAVKDLSTGAREQVFLGARLGFARRALDDLPAFLVLGIVPVVIGLAGEAFARW